MMNASGCDGGGLCVSRWCDDAVLRDCDADDSRMMVGGWWDDGAMMVC